ncbi:MAG: hypothetical protein AAFX93_19650 [Verrucomicrobiota bacterium]
MPAPENNDYAAGIPGQNRDANCHFRTYRTRKGAYKLASELVGEKLTPWIEHHLDDPAIRILRERGRDDVADALQAIIDAEASR